MIVLEFSTFYLCRNLDKNKANLNLWADKIFKAPRQLFTDFKY